MSYDRQSAITWRGLRTILNDTSLSELKMRRLRLLSLGAPILVALACNTEAPTDLSPTAGVIRRPQQALAILPATARLSAGAYHNCALKLDGTVVCWGGNQYGQLSVPVGLASVAQVDAAVDHYTCAVKTDGSVVCWGNENYYDFGQTTMPTGLSSAIQVSGGLVHACALKADGTVACWGLNNYGQTNVPTGLVGVVQINAASDHSCAVKADGTVVCWGLNNEGRTTVPSGLNSVVQVTGGQSFNCALKTDGTVVCWGGNQSGQLAVPPGLASVTQISAGRAHTCALKADGTVACWGYNGNGELNVPSGLSSVVQVSSAEYHSCALRLDETVVCWGGNQNGEGVGFNLVQLAQVISFTSQSPSPAKVGGFYTVAATGGGSGNPVAFSSATPTTCTVSRNSVVLISNGTCTVAANQSGGSGFLDALKATQSFTVFAKQDIQFTSAPPGPAHVGGVYAVTATGGSSGNPVLFSSSDPSVCRVVGGLVVLVSAGTCKINANQNGSDSYFAAPQVRQTFTVLPEEGLNGFHLASNGITVKCASAPIGATGVVNGVKYTRRSRDELYALVAAGTYAELPTTCTSGITDMNSLFAGRALFNQPIGSWDVSAVTNMSGMFADQRFFNQPIGAWDVSAVTSMRGMFQDVAEFNQPIGAWDVSAVTDMTAMFAESDFNQPIGAWDVSAVTSMYAMFRRALFNQPIGAWDVSAVTSMGSMFGGNPSFDQPIGGWDVSAVTDMSEMFASAVFNQPIGAWDVSAVRGMTTMFAMNRSFNQPIGAWDVSAVTDMGGMFYGAGSFNQNLSLWCVTLLPVRPQEFDNSATSWTAARPVWGTCPTP